MISKHTQIHPKFKLNGQSHTKHSLVNLANQYVGSSEAFEAHIGNFLLDWLNEKDYVLVKTSGSTGAPKIIQIKKQAMVNSALATGSFFGLEPSQSALHCLPTNFIAGKMMLVRAMILGLELDIVIPSSKPSISTDELYDFCAMVPLQLQNSLKNLQNIKTLIVGGAQVSKYLESQLKDVPTRIYATYGMTETVTHIAVKPLNHNIKSNFEVLPGINISKDNRDCLVIDAPHLNDAIIITNDIVTINNNLEFELLGRYDNVINSGGIKLIPEQIEKKLEALIPYRFFITSEYDNALGEQVILIIESEKNTIDKSVFDTLDKYERPKRIYYLNQFIETKTSKINRNATRNMINI